MRQDIYKDGVKTQFSKDNQPSNESKRVPKIKTRLKKMVRDHIEKFEEGLEKGNPAFWKMALDNVVEKPKSTVENKIKGEIDNKVEVILVKSDDEDKDT